MQRVAIINSQHDVFHKYVVPDVETANQILEVLNANRQDSEVTYYITYADYLTSPDQLSKYEYLDAEREEGEELFVFHRKDGGWKVLYVLPERVEDVFAQLGDEYVGYNN